MAQFLLQKMDYQQASVIRTLANCRQQSLYLSFEKKWLIETITQLADLQKANIEALLTTQTIQQKVEMMMILLRDVTKEGSNRLLDSRNTQQFQLLKDFYRNCSSKSKQEINELFDYHAPLIRQKKHASIIQLLIAKLKCKFEEFKKTMLSIDQLKMFMDKLKYIVNSRIQRYMAGKPQVVIHAQKMKIGIIIYSEIEEQTLDRSFEPVSRALKVKILQQAIKFTHVLSFTLLKIAIQNLLQSEKTIVRFIFLWFPQIQNLRLAKCELGNETISYLKKLVLLQRLDLSGNQIDNTGIMYLYELALSSNPISNKGLSYFVKFCYWPKLSKLITKDGLKLINRLSSKLLTLGINNLSQEITSGTKILYAIFGNRHSQRRQMNKLL